MSAYTYAPSVDGAGHLISEPCTAGNLVAEFRRRGIAPDECHDLTSGKLSLWLVGNMYAALLQMDGWQLTSPVRYINTTEAAVIAADILRITDEIASVPAMLAISTADLARVSTPLLQTELNRRIAAKTPKPKSLAPCVGCQAPLSARERRKPCPHCGARNPR